MKLLVLATASLLTVQLASAKLEVVQRLSKEQLAAFDQLPAGVTVAAEGEASSPVLHIVSDGREAADLKLVTIKHPPLNTPYYAIRGEISYADVASDGYVEMWVYYGEVEAYFSRAVAERGPMGKLSDQSGRRGFCLPFDSAAFPSPPTKLVMDIKLPGKGNVTLRNLRLEQAGSLSELLGDQAVASFGSPSSGSKAGLIGGIAGAVIGCLGSLLEFLSSRGRARSFVIGTAWALAGLGAASLGAGLMSLMTRQAPALSYVLLLMGVLCVVIFPVRLRRYLRQYRQTELRRIDSLDALGT